jgi:hypothetical protein
MTTPPVWNSLEVVKLLVAALTPIVVGVGGYWINRRLKSLEAAQWSQQKIVERRIQAYDELAPSVNRLFCFFAYLGSWKETKPSEVISLSVHWMSVRTSANGGAYRLGPFWLQK